MRKLFAEFIGTFFLVLTVVVTAATKTALAPLAIGGVLVTMVFAGGHISGAHYNPAVTLAVFVRGRIAAGEVPGYIAAQTVGAVAAALTGSAIARMAGATFGSPLSLTGGRLGAAFTAELLMTFALAYVVLNVATSSSHPSNSFYGLAIGMTVAVTAVTVGGISGGVINPAVATGASLSGILSWSMIWVYLTADFAGGALAAVAFRVLNPQDCATPAAQLPRPRSASNATSSDTSAGVASLARQ